MWDPFKQFNSRPDELLCRLCLLKVHEIQKTCLTSSQVTSLPSIMKIELTNLTYNKTKLLVKILFHQEH